VSVVDGRKKYYEKMRKGMEKTAKVKPILQQGRANNELENLVMAPVDPPQRKTTASVATVKKGGKKIETADSPGDIEMALTNPLYISGPTDTVAENATTPERINSEIPQIR
jgi:hypothetical protein